MYIKVSFILSGLLLYGCISEIEIPEHIKDLEHLTIHEIPEDTDTLVFKREQAFGSTEAALIGRIFKTAVDNSGRVFLSDLDKDIIFSFNPDGSFITSLGRKGRGPGEFSHVSSIEISSDRLYAYDSPQHRFNVFSLDSLEFSETINLELSGSYPDTYFIQENESILMGLVSFGSKKESYTEYYTMDMNGKVVSDKHFEQKRANFHTNKELGISSILPFGDRPLIARSTDGLICLARTADFLIRIYDSKGEYLSAFYYPFKKAVLDKASFINGFGSTKYQQFYQDVTFPDTWPALENMLTDDENRLWISTIVEDQEVYQWWVLNTSGELQARFRWPRDKPIQIIKNGKIYTRETAQETRLQRIVRYDFDIALQ